MSATVIERDMVVRHAPMILRAVDAVSGALVSERLAIDIAPYGPGRVVRAFPTKSGGWSAVDLPGLRGYENAPDFIASTDELAARRATRRRFRISVTDLGGRYLPCAFDTALPTDELAVGLAPGDLPMPFATTAASPPDLGIVVPLFADPGAPAAATGAELRAELRVTSSGQPAAWAMLRADIEGMLRGIALTDANGRAVLRFPFPDRPHSAFTSPPAPAATVWSVDVAAFWVAPAQDQPLAKAADLSGLVAQLASPRRLLATGSPPSPLGPVEIAEGVPAVLRSDGTPFLALEAA